ncbi:heparan-sulfate lyase [Mariniphaga anaerophila]|uniref:Heparan-sulfate lyase n=1 Tax=Mariniphaga anaerophila TaxID=1484053 RepID=A0A1M5G1D3_9BACT|nr:heparin-sulfate lyase HepC [Mariniphaga anaerophila]SHF97252.1 heparan-sulfate lyase [Mariniphaga anaerophila]
MKTGILLTALLVATAFLNPVFAGDTPKVYEILNLDFPGFEKVKQHVENKDYTKAQEALLDYYRQRTSIKHPDVNREDKQKMKGKRLDESTLEKANNGLKHHFFVHKGYGYFDFGDTINWQYWPVKDNEIRWQLNRMYWWIPMGEAYWSTGDEKYAKEWVWQMRDWIKDNPRGLSKENDRFAWRPLETARRVQDQTNLFNYFIDSPNFTADFLVEFLVNYYVHAECIRQNYSERGNHLLFEAQRLIYAGGFFPEFINAGTWRKEGIDILNTEIEKQVYADGMQYELSLNYHIAAINIFLKALYMAQLCNMEDEFPKSYSACIENMIIAIANASFPDYTYPMFSDAKRVSDGSMQKNYQSWLKVFPDNEVIRYFATKGKNGNAPGHLSKGLTNSGIYTFRNGWKKDATVLILKASPPAFWHSQPDNGTFELWVKGRNFMPDAGCYVYSGDDEIMKLRNWYRQTKVHQTLTLNNENINVDAHQIRWSVSPDLDELKYSNPSYDNLDHERNVFFVDQSFFVLVDKAIGKGTGQVDLHYQLIEGNANVNAKAKSIATTFDDGNNVIIRCFGPKTMELIEEEGKVSYSYRKEIERPAVAFRQPKPDGKTVKFITVICPFDGQKAPEIKAAFITSKDNKEQVELVVNGKKHLLDI